MVENTITATSKATGEAILLTRDPFGQSGAISSIYVDEDACYYASSGEVGDGFQIYRIDLKDFSTRPLPPANIKPETEPNQQTDNSQEQNHQKSKLLRRDTRKGHYINQVPVLVISGDGSVSVGAVCCCLLVGRPGWSILSAAKPVLF